MLATISDTEPVATGMALTVQSYCAWAMGDVSAALAASALTVLRDAGNETALLYAMMSRAISAAVDCAIRTESRALYLEASSSPPGPVIPLSPPRCSVTSATSSATR